ncbi:MAG: hypothetical protein L0Y71_25335 [Gemmataceae bacterium]|nr:hypothetical protein [Gemmataceae bacterium]
MRTLACTLLLAAMLSQPAVGGGKTTVTLGTLKSDAPAAWKTAKSPFKTRLYTFVVPKAEGVDRDAEIQVIFFGAGGGGGLPENIKRWKGMFVAPEGKTIDDVAKQETFKAGGAKVTTLDLQGTYLDKFPPFAPNAKTIRRPDYRRINVYFETDDGVYFIIFVGPAKSVAQQQKAFDEWLKAFK